VAIEDAKLNGTTLSFVAKLDRSAATRSEFSGRIVNHAIEGTMRTAGAGAASKPVKWRAARSEAWVPRHETLPPPTLIPPQPQ
jgi:hypothetical protein